MRTETASPTNQAAPQLGTAMVNLAIAAQERAFALNMSVMQQLLSRTAQRSDEAASSATIGALATLPAQPMRLTPQPVAAEPVFRYVAELLQIYQNATAAMAELLTAQTRGEQGQIETLTKEARDQASEAASTAMTAVGSVLTAGIEVTNRLTTAAAQAGQELAAQATARVAQAAEDTEHGAAAHHNGRRVHRLANGHAKHP